MKRKQAQSHEQQIAELKANIEGITIEFMEAMHELSEHGLEDALWDLLIRLDPPSKQEVKGE